MPLRTHVAGFLLFAASVTSYAWPFMQCPGGRPDTPDAHAMTWIMLAVFRDLLTQPAALFQGETFYPMGNSLTYTEPLLVPALVAGSLFALTGNPVQAHKISLLLLWALSGWATYAVAFWLTPRHAAGLLAALIFTLSLPRPQYALDYPL